MHLRKLVEFEGKGVEEEDLFVAVVKTKVTCNKLIDLLRSNRADEQRLLKKVKIGNRRFRTLTDHQLLIALKGKEKRLRVFSLEFDSEDALKRL